MLAKEEVKPTLPEAFDAYIQHRLMNGKTGGRPNLLQRLKRENRDVKNEILNMAEMAWVNGKGLRQIAKKYKTTYVTIWRILQDLEEWKPQLIAFLQIAPRRKRWFTSQTVKGKLEETSDYDTVQTYINRAKRDLVQDFAIRIRNAERCWKALKYKNPANWKADEVLMYLSSLSYGSASGKLDAIRQVAPQIRDKDGPDYIGTGRFRAKLKRRKKDLFGPEVKMMIEALRSEGLSWEEIIFKLHVTTGAREGYTKKESGLTGISWARFKKNFTQVDIFESKVKGGIWSRNCPTDILFRDLPSKLKEEWVLRGKPTDAKLLPDPKELLTLYKTIRQACGEYWHGKVDPSLLKEMTTLRPHDADKIHVNLLWEAEVPLEVVAGQYVGQSEGLGLVGRIWLTTDIIKKHYLSMTQRSARYKKMLAHIREYATQFNGGD